MPCAGLRCITSAPVFDAAEWPSTSDWREDDDHFPIMCLEQYMTAELNSFALNPRGHLVAEVVDRIQQMVISRALKPGDSLPPEDELARQMQVSRTALREGKRILSDRGLIEVRQGVGTVVCEVGEEQITAQLRLYAATRFGGIDFEQFHGVREMLETEIAALAAAQRDAADIEELRVIMCNMVGSMDTPEVFVEHDVAFHVALARMSGNLLLALLAVVIRDLLASHITDVIAHIQPERDVVPFHQAILDALEAGDAEAARQAMADHLDQVRVNYSTAQSLS